VDNGNYLLYRLEGNTWIYGVREDRKAPLPQLTGDYNWLPLDGGGRPYNQGGGKEGITVSQMSD
jgi:hypothetical protein